MDHDIFLDCPQCSHTIKVSSSLIGILVECPDCGHAFKVPDIRNGLNPRLRRKEGGSPSEGSIVRLMNRSERLKEGFSDLLHQQEEQLRHLKFLEDNARIVLQQLELFSSPEAPNLSGTAGLNPVPEPSEAENPSVWLRWSLIFGWLTLGISIGMALLYLKNL